MWFLAALLVAVAEPVPPAARAEDNRELIELAPDIRDRFLERMREDLVNLNDVLAAIAEGDFEGAARIAERRMGFAHGRIERMEARGASDAEVAAAIGEIRAMAEAHGTDLPGAMHGGGGGGRGGMGVGRFMPEELRALGMAFHQTAYPLADAARAVDADPSEENFRALFSALGDMTLSCLGCHEAYRVK
jgi:hypothetical protein